MDNSSPHPSEAQNDQTGIYTFYMFQCGCLKDEAAWTFFLEFTEHIIVFQASLPLHISLY